MKPNYAAHVVVTLCSYDREIKTVSERLLKFNTESEMNETIHKIFVDLESKGLTFNGKNKAKYYDLSYRPLTKDEIEFVFAEQITR